MSRPPKAEVKELDFARLLEDARRGDIEALGALLQHYRAYLLMVANKELAKDARARMAPSDLVQDTLLRAQQRFGQFRGSGEKALLGWLRKILRYRLADLPPRREMLPLPGVQGGLPDKGDTPSKELARKEEQDLVQKALAQLQADHQQVIRLREFDDLPFNEVGQRMQRSADAARKLWSRAIDELGRILKLDADDELPKNR